MVNGASISKVIIGVAKLIPLQHVQKCMRRLLPDVKHKPGESGEQITPCGAEDERRLTRMNERKLAGIGGTPIRCAKNCSLSAAIAVSDAAKAVSSLNCIISIITCSIMFQIISSFCVVIVMLK